MYKENPFLQKIFEFFAGLGFNGNHVQHPMQGTFLSLNSALSLIHDENNTWIHCIHLKEVNRRQSKNIAILVAYSTASCVAFLVGAIATG